jgi:hypothetical protein
MVDRPEREELIRAHLSYLGFDLERELGSLDWIVRDRREGHGVLRALQPTKCSLQSVIDLFELEL